MDVTFTSPYVKDRRFRTRSFVRSVADWNFSPKGGEGDLKLKSASGREIVQSATDSVEAGRMS